MGVSACKKRVTGNLSLGWAAENLLGWQGVCGMCPRDNARIRITNMKTDQGEQALSGCLGSIATYSRLL